MSGFQMPTVYYLSKNCLCTILLICPNFKNCEIVHWLVLFYNSKIILVPNFKVFFRKLVLLKLEKGYSFGDCLLDGTIPDRDSSKELSKEVLASTLFNQVTN